MTKTLDEAGARLRLELLTAISAKYGSVSPVRLAVEPSDVMKGYCVTCSIPGQDRKVLITQKQMEVWRKEVVPTFALQPAREAIVDSVLFAIFLLLDEDDEND